MTAAPANSRPPLRQAVETSQFHPAASQPTLTLHAGERRLREHTAAVLLNQAPRPRLVLTALDGRQREVAALQRA